MKTECIAEFTRKMSSMGGQMVFSVPIDELRKGTLRQKERYFLRVYAEPNVPVEEGLEIQDLTNTGDVLDVKKKELLTVAFDLIWDKLSTKSQQKLLDESEPTNSVIMKAIGVLK